VFQLTMSLCTLLVTRSAVVHCLCALHILHRSLCRLHIPICASAQGVLLRSIFFNIWTCLVRPLALYATWKRTFHILSISNLTFHVARFLRDSLYASNIRYNGLYLFSGSYGHADRPDLA